MRVGLSARARNVRRLNLSRPSTFGIAMATYGYEEGMPDSAKRKRSCFPPPVADIVFTAPCDAALCSIVHVAMPLSSEVELTGGAWSTGTAALSDIPT